ncbi:ribonuclease domain-containing protein [Streptomyces acidiscabies]|uniref:Ribonuclease n=1 Tax=Streptomyces acidiscabies TaxID=42234 RepID=A0AAP6B856_9ACTN|nr:ribonuclease [Streptomyces acidiscabies]MBP5940831.1 ribonuclease N [Streptomyces sp. LBUM 1476]MBZ3912117.1 ribonuclease [Streptomyces acidiscabies]MDX2959926.1 ribonuclease [Streptomyces acidiscabies]MDX3024133.1 ribonuclease [Streptomyces acidiscabies]MDX3794556.1 ribonuclease [Streptomyces acidiscabies]
MLLRFVSRVLLCVLVSIGGVAGCSSDHRTNDVQASASSSRPSNGLATVKAADLPAEARKTLALIDQGGPYPYSRDGVVFGNFEGRLPKQKRGYYHEYTVKTPGSRDRGARRIVTGQSGEIYYTDDHYDSFRTVLR